MSVAVRFVIAFLLVLFGLGFVGTPRAVSLQSAPGPSPTDTSDAASRVVQKYLIKGVTEAQLGDYEEAILYFETALDRAPEAPALLQALADAHEAQGDYSTALFYAQQACRQAPGRPYYRHRRAELQTGAGQPEAALRTYTTLIDHFPTYTPGYRALAALQNQQGRPADAVRTYRALIDQTDRVPVTVYEKMLPLQRRLSDSTGLKRTLQVLVARRPSQPRYQRLLGHHYAAANQTEAALDLLAPLAARKPNDAALQQQVQQLRQAVGPASRASVSPPGAKADRGSSTSLGELVSTARSALDAGNMETALTKVRAALNRAPESVGALELRARLHTRQGAYAEAGQALEQALETNPRSPVRWGRAAEAYLQARQYDTAASVAEEGLLLFPGTVSLLRTASLAHLHAGTTQRARAHLQKALDVLPASTSDTTRAGLHAQLGQAYTHLGRPQAADSALATALKIAPKAPAVLRTYAYSLALRKEDLDRALRLARRAVKQSPYHPRAHHALGWVQYQKGRLEAAQRHLQTAIEKRAPTPRLLEHAGDVARARGNEAAAQRYWKRAAELVPPRPSLRKKLDRGSSP